MSIYILASNEKFQKCTAKIGTSRKLRGKHKAGLGRFYRKPGLMEPQLLRCDV